MARLGDVCDVRDGTHDSPVYIDRGFPLVTSKNIINGKLDLSVVNYISPEDYNKINERSNVECGDIIMPMIGTIGNPYIVGDFTDFAIKNVALIKFNNEQINNKYIYHFLNSEKFNKYVAENNRGGTQKFLSLKDIRNLEVEVPSLKEQLIIIEKLDGLNELILSRKQQLSKLDEFVKARFVEMFGDPKLNDKGWDSGMVSDYFDVKGGKRIPKGMGYSDKKTNHPYLRATDMKNETIIEDDIHYIDEDVFQHIKSYTVKGGDIYLTNVGVNLGMAGVIPQKFDGASLTENAVKLIPKTEKVIDGLFLAHYINSPGIQEYINERKMSVGVPKLAIFRIETMPLLIPPMDVQQDFNAFVEQVDKSKFEVQQSLEKLETLKKSLMQQYFG